VSGNSVQMNNEANPQTRRIVKIPVWVADATSVEQVGPWFHFNADHPKGKCGEKKCGCIGSENKKQPSMWTVTCPYGVAGDRLWVREAWKPDNKFKGGGIPRLGITFGEGVQWRAANPDQTGPWKPSIHMPRWASRITLEITKVRVERLQDISEEDAKAEGVDYQECGRIGMPKRSHIAGYASLWDSLHGKGAWELNPFVWVIDFCRVGNENHLAARDKQEADLGETGVQP
jgi:hypothetical protein